MKRKKAETRRRMFLIERAYVDLDARWNEWTSLAGRTCRSVWAWFWSGAGSSVVRRLLRAVLFLGPLSVAGYFVWKDYRETGGFQVESLAAIVVVLVYGISVLFAWEGPIRFMAKLASGLLGFAAVFVASVVAFIVLGVLIGLYIALLIPLTVASIAVILPLRICQALWILKHRITYRCPWDECPSTRDGGKRSFPVHLCSQGHRYTDLYPSLYGILSHECRHDDGSSEKLPTLDVLGRSRLRRVCSVCDRPLRHSSLGDLEEWPVAVVGGTGAGKTTFILQALEQLRHDLRRHPGSTVSFDSREQLMEYESERELLDSGQIADKTVGDVMQAFGLVLKIPHKLDCLLYVFDAPGEDFASMKRLERKQVLRHIRGIVLIVDPFSLEGLAGFEGRSRAVPSDTPLRDVVSNLIRTIEALRGARSGKRWDIPVAVVLTKADELPAADYAYLADLYPRNGSVAAEQLDARCREALEELGEGRTIRDLELRFQDVSYFACSALGRSPDNQSAAFEPVGVADPLKWLLEIEH